MTASHEGKLLGGRYTLRRLLGVGGVCAVYEAEHRFSGRRVAVKILRDEYTLHDEARARLLDEARALGMVRHPHVVEIHDAGFSGAYPYVSMELLDGRSLEHVLASRARLPSHEAAEVARQAALALHAVHKAGLVHRDVKPGNLFVVRSAHGHEQVRLIDFGVAWLPRAQLAAVGEAADLVGTPEYMAPEQVRRRPDLDARADLYSLGAVMYECVTGRVPIAGSLDEVAQRQTGPVVARVRSVASDAHEGLAAVVERCLAFAPEERFVDALSLVAALDATGLTHRPLGLLERPAWTSPHSGIIPVGRREAMERAADAHPGRREHPRALYNGPVRVESAGVVYSLYAQDLSEGGLMAVGPRVLAQGERVHLEFALPTTGTVIRTEAVVQWVRDQEGASRMSCAVGFCFTDTSARLRDTVLAFLNSA